jgi:adenine/guanine phosphoribosyltransferase-like PRPP-binding protein
MAGTMGSGGKMQASARRTEQGNRPAGQDAAQPLQMQGPRGARLDALAGALAGPQGDQPIQMVGPVGGGLLGAGLGGLIGGGLGLLARARSPWAAVAAGLGGLAGGLLGGYLGHRAALAAPSSVRTGKAAFNAQQSEAVPAKGELVGAIDRCVAAMDQGGRLLQLPYLREMLDVLVSVHADGMMAHGAANDEHDPLTAVALAQKQPLIHLRQVVEHAFQKLIREQGQAGTPAYEGELAHAIAAAWANVPSKDQLTAVSQATEKTGKREPRQYRVDRTDERVSDTSIDIRAAKIAKLVTDKNFKPDMVVGLPTAGIQIASRVAGHLDAATESLAELTQVAALRPRYVKAQGAVRGADKRMEALNQQSLSGTIAGTPALAGIHGRAVRVLVVDDFTLSGGSLGQAKALILQALGAVEKQGDVRTVVSRYTTAQLHDRLGQGAAEIDNPINYMVGTAKSDSRTAIRDDVAKNGYDAYETVDQGWRETGQQGIDLALE